MIPYHHKGWEGRLERFRLFEKYREQFELRTETDSFSQENIRVWQIHEFPDVIVPIMAKHMSAEQYLRNVRGKHNIPPLDFHLGKSKK